MQFSDLSSDVRSTYMNQSLQQKIETAHAVIAEAYAEHDPNAIAVAWTGGKDSTLLLWLVREWTRKHDKPLPKIVFIDEGDVFDEIWKFADTLSNKWSFEYSVAHNSDVSSAAGELGAEVAVADLNERNRAAIRDLDYSEDVFLYKPESLVGNHLMKTVACQLWMEKSGVEALITGVRWDEQEARSADDFIRQISDHDHLRYEPILHFLEQDVWDMTHKYDIPYVSLYEKGYRSLGARSTTDAVSDVPAWKWIIFRIKNLYCILCSRIIHS